MNIWTLHDINKKYVNYKFVDCIEKYNFVMDQINLQGCLKILNLSIWELETNFRDCKQLQ
jgi:hypothetical protein